jgi:ribosomal 50S subunit-recycling heat shock protein
METKQIDGVKVNEQGLVEYEGKRVKPYRYDKKTGIVVFRIGGKVIRTKVNDRVIERRASERKSKKVNERKAEIENTLLSEYLKTIKEGNEPKAFAIWCDMCNEAQPYIYPDRKIPEWQTRLLAKIRGI